MVCSTRYSSGFDSDFSKSFLHKFFRSFFHLWSISLSLFSNLHQIFFFGWSSLCHTKWEMNFSILSMIETSWTSGTSLRIFIRRVTYSIKTSSPVITTFESVPDFDYLELEDVISSVLAVDWLWVSKLYLIVSLRVHFIISSP